MNAPDRSEWVTQIFNANPPETIPFPDDDVRLVYLMEVLLPALKKMETEGEWGYLIKTDQGNKVPSDVIVWKDTMEHFDILTGTGPAWQPDGVVPNPDWVFGGLIEIPSDPPPVDPPPPGEDQFTSAELMAEIRETHRLAAEIMGKLEHYDREFAKIQPKLFELLARFGLGDLFKEGQ